MSTEEKPPIAQFEKALKQWMAANKDYVRAQKNQWGVYGEYARGRLVLRCLYDFAKGVTPPGYVTDALKEELETEDLPALTWLWNELAGDTELPVPWVEETIALLIAHKEGALAKLNEITRGQGGDIERY